MIITDAQVHVWRPETADRPWPDGTRDYAHGDAMPAETMVRLMDATGVHRAVLVPPSWEGDRNDYCAAAARAHPERFTVAGRIPLDRPKDAGELRRWCAAGALRGIRLTFSRGASREWLRDGTAEWLWPAAQAAGVPVFLFAPGLLDEVARIARRYPRLRIAVDHLALGTELRDQEIDPVLDALLPLAAFENVAVKATSLPSYVSEEFPFPSLHARISRVIDAFGVRRVFWGSDVTRLPVAYRECVELFTCALPFLSGEDRSWVMGRALSEWIGWSADPRADKIVLR